MNVQLWSPVREGSYSARLFCRVILQGEGMGWLVLGFTGV